MNDRERQLIEQVCRLGNQRTRLKHVLELSWSAMKFSEEIQENLMRLTLDGNSMHEIKLKINKKTREDLEELRKENEKLQEKLGDVEYNYAALIDEKEKFRVENERLRGRLDKVKMILS